MTRALTRHGYGRNDAVLQKLYSRNLRGTGYAALQHRREVIFRARATIAELSAAGIEVRPYVTHRSDEERWMDNAVHALRVGKQRYAEALTAFCSRPGPRFPRKTRERERLAA